MAKKITLTEEQIKAGWVDMHVAVRSGDLEQVEMRLLSNFNEINAQTKTGETPLHFAAKLNKEKMVELLVQSGADVDAQDNSGCTPLQAAFISVRAIPSKKAVIITLIHNGADVNFTMSKGTTCWDLAYDSISKAAKKDLDILIKIAAAKKVNLLSKSPEEDVDNFTLLHIAAIENDLETIKSSQNKIDVAGAQIKTGDTVLHLAAMFGGSIEVLKQLIIMGANTDEINDNGQTPQQVALMYNHEDIAEYLGNSTPQEAADETNDHDNSEENNDISNIEKISLTDNEQQSNENRLSANVADNQSNQVTLLSDINTNEWAEQ